MFAYFAQVAMLSQALVIICSIGLHSDWPENWLFQAAEMRLERYLPGDLSLHGRDDVNRMMVAQASVPVPVADAVPGPEKAGSPPDLNERDSTIVVGDVVATTGPVNLMMGVRTVARVPGGTELTVLEIRENWIGVLHTRGRQEIRAWVQPRFVEFLPRVVIQTQETSLGRAWDGIDWSSAAVAADGKRIAYVVREDGGSRVVVDGKPGAVFDQIELGHPVLSQDGQRVAYAAKRGEQWFVVVDGKVGGPYESVDLGHPVVNADGSNVIYVVRKENGQFLVVNDEELGPYEAVLEGSPVVSPRGKDYAYATRSNGAWLVYLNGEEFASFDRVAIEDMAFQVDGSQFACIGKRNGSVVVCVDNQKLASHENARLPWFLPGEGGLCYQARDEGKWSMVVGSERSERFDDVGDFVAGVEKSGVAFWAREGREWRVVHGEEKGRGYDGFGRGSLTVGAQGQVAYVALRDGKAIVVVDGKESPAYDGVLAGTPVFSPTGESIAYAALREGKWRLYVDDVEQEVFERVAEYSVRFTPDGSQAMALVGVGDRLALAVGDAVSQHSYRFPRGSYVLPISADRLMAVGVRGEEFLRLEVEIEVKR